MRSSLEAPRTKPATPSKQREFPKASYLVLYGALAFGALGCEKIDPDPATLTPLEKIRAGDRKTVEEVVTLTLAPRPAGTLVESSSLQLEGNWQGQTNARQLNAAIENVCSIDATTRTATQIDHVMFHAEESQEAALELHRVQFRYRYARTVVGKPRLRAGGAAESTRIVSQQLTVHPVGERLPRRDSQPTPLRTHYTANSYEAALGQALLLIVKPAEGVVNARMLQDQATAIQNHVRFQGETCGPLTTPGMTESIYCMREFNETTSLTIEDIRSEIQPNGFVRVDVSYHTDSSEPATPGR